MNIVRGAGTVRLRAAIHVLVSASMLFWSVCEGPSGLSGLSSSRVDGSTVITVWDGSGFAPIGQQREGTPEHFGGLVASARLHPVRPQQRAIAHHVSPAVALLEQGKGLITLQTSSDI